MKQNELTRFLIVDNSGVKEIRSFSSYQIRIGDVVTASVKKVASHFNDTKNKTKVFKKGQIVKALVVSTRSYFRRANNSLIKFNKNCAVIIDKKEPVGTRVFVPLLAEFAQWGYEKFLSQTQEIL
jgi:large subunit ribosomal protein L14